MFPKATVSSAKSVKQTKKNQGKTENQFRMHDAIET